MHVPVVWRNFLSPVQYSGYHQAEGSGFRDRCTFSGMVNMCSIGSQVEVLDSASCCRLHAYPRNCAGHGGHGHVDSMEKILVSKKKCRFVRLDADSFRIWSVLPHWRLRPPCRLKVFMRSPLGEHFRASDGIGEKSASSVSRKHGGLRSSTAVQAVTQWNVGPFNRASICNRPDLPLMTQNPVYRRSAFLSLGF